MSGAPPNVPASICSVLDSCRSVGTGARTRGGAFLVWFEERPELLDHVQERLLAGLVPLHEVHVVELLQTVLNELFPPRAMFVRRAALDGEAARPRVQLHDGGGGGKSNATGLGLATLKHDARQQDGREVSGIPSHR